MVFTGFTNQNIQSSTTSSQVVFDWMEEEKEQLVAKGGMKYD